MVNSPRLARNLMCLISVVLIAGCNASGGSGPTASSTAPGSTAKPSPSPSPAPSSPSTPTTTIPFPKRSPLPATTPSPAPSPTPSGSGWSLVPTFPSGTTTSVLVNPGNSRVLYAGTQGQGVATSTDGGATWSTTTTGLTTQNVNALAFDPSFQAPSGTTGLLWATTDVGVFTSSDGSTWTDVSAGLPQKLTPVRAIAVNPLTSGVAYVSQENQTLQVTTDSGATWKALSNGSTLGLRATALLCSPSSATTVYAGLIGGLLVSTDSGATWTQTNVTVAPTPQTAGEVTSLAFDGSGNLYAGDDAGIVWKAPAGSSTFTAKNGGSAATSAFAGTVFSLAADPTAGAQTVYAVLVPAVMKSLDGGQTWFAVDGGIPQPPLASPALFQAVIDPRAPETLYLATGFGLDETFTGGQ